jgi:hypothetical protein
MALREFRDAGGRAWHAWDTYPTLPERRRPNAPALPPEGRERRRVSSPRIALPRDLAHGWLTFESGRERRRLVPVPERWETASDEQLRAWMNEAELLPPTRRLIE